MFDVIIAGGSNAGLSAALMLGRSRRNVLVVDAAQPRNAPSPAIHGFYGRDGTPPSELLQIGRDQLRPYPGVELCQGHISHAQQSETGFEVVLGDGARHQSRKLILATGVRDELPAIEGLAERWGTSVFHCPYCHGWEVRDQRLAVLWTTQHSLDLAELLTNWSSDVVLCTHGLAKLGDEERQRLERAGVVIDDRPIATIEGQAGSIERISFTTGEPLARDAIFMRPNQHQQSDLAHQLGCALTEPYPGMLLVEVNSSGQTSVPGVYAAGDTATLMQQAITAAANGAMAGAMLNRELVLEDVAGGV